MIGDTATAGPSTALVLAAFNNLASVGFVDGLSAPTQVANYILGGGGNLSNVTSNFSFVFMADAGAGHVFTSVQAGTTLNGASPTISFSSDAALLNLLATFTLPPTSSATTISPISTVYVRETTSGVNDTFNGPDSITARLKIAAVPEPVSIALLGTGPLGPGAARRRSI